VIATQSCTGLIAALLTEDPRLLRMSRARLSWPPTREDQPRLGDAAVIAAHGTVFSESVAPR
jgi:hypothetical protein